MPASTVQREPFCLHASTKRLCGVMAHATRSPHHLSCVSYLAGRTDVWCRAAQDALTKQREADASLVEQRAVLRAQRAAELKDAEAAARARAVEFEGPVMRARMQEQVGCRLTANLCCRTCWQHSRTVPMEPWSRRRVNWVLQIALQLSNGWQMGRISHPLINS